MKKILNMLMATVVFISSCKKDEYIKPMEPVTPVSTGKLLTKVIEEGKMTASANGGVYTISYEQTAVGGQVIVAKEEFLVATPSALHGGQLSTGEQNSQTYIQGTATSTGLRFTNPYIIDSGKTVHVSLFLYIKNIGNRSGDIVSQVNLKTTLDRVEYMMKGKTVIDDTNRVGPEVVAYKSVPRLYEYQQQGGVENISNGVETLIKAYELYSEGGESSISQLVYDTKLVHNNRTRDTMKVALRFIIIDQYGDREDITRKITMSNQNGKEMKDKSITEGDTKLFVSYSKTPREMTINPYYHQNRYTQLIILGTAKNFSPGETDVFKMKFAKSTIPASSPTFLSFNGIRYGLDLSPTANVDGFKGSIWSDKNWHNHIAAPSASSGDFYPLDELLENDQESVFQSRSTQGRESSINLDQSIKQRKKVSIVFLGKHK